MSASAAATVVSAAQKASSFANNVSLYSLIFNMIAVFLTKYRIHCVCFFFLIDKYFDLNIQLDNFDSNMLTENIYMYILKDCRNSSF
jgi:hypothetical protein